MKRSIFILFILFLSQAVIGQGIPKIPDGFLYVKEVIPTIELDVRYFSSNNFVGKPIQGYYAPKCILTKEAAYALMEVQQELKQYGLGLKIFDAYRPQQAVNHFVQWAEDPYDKTNKEIYYPNVPKNKLFKKGYIASKSGHSRGSTVDLTIVSLRPNESKEELPMGTPFDYFGKESWPDYKEISMTSRAHRLLLKLVMEKYGFKSLPTEWWHFTLKNEPYPDRYFDFLVQ